MHGFASLPIFKVSLRCPYKRHFLRYLQRHRYFTTSSKSKSRKYIFRFGFITLTAAGSSLAVFISSTKPSAPPKEKELVVPHEAEILVKQVAAVDQDLFCVGIDTDWQLYCSSPYTTDFGSRLQIILFNLIHFNVTRLWDWLFPWEQSKSDDPWALLELTRSSNFWIRQMGVASLANQTSWPHYKYRIVAQTCDPRTLVALARYPHANNAFFLPQPKVITSKNDIVTDLKNQVLKLPVPPLASSCVMYYRHLALDQEICMNDSLGFDNLTQSYSFPEDEDKKKEKEIRNCLDAISSYTSIPDFGSQFVSNHGLAVLQQLCEKFPETWVQIYVATILTNLSQTSEHLDLLARTGWITVLRGWTKSNNATLSMQALTTLANLDREWLSKDIYQDIVLLHPAYRNSQPVYADVVLVHGLRGGAVKTWRQRDQPNEPVNPFVSKCWPRDWLASDCPNVRIISIGYNSTLHLWGDHCPYEQEKRTIEGRSREIIQKLLQAGVGSRPIIWVGHSMGGLLIKKIISLGEHETEFSKFSTQTKGVVFYSVPHRGSSIVDTMMYAKYLLFPSVEVQELHTNSPALIQLHTEFVNFVTKNSISCLSFGENAKTPFGRPLPKMLVVSSNSSDPGVGQFISVPDNHIDICKPCCETDVIYQMTYKFVNDILNTVR
ncbi:protein SERAC1-like [Physella acuta]|uniref:protein SERAC1-like n=1 Tax=Physella acuta TaxID=109671 RepID=UPI0027DE4786|nr:protein SERAC1-like [Physella acuta]